VLDQEKPKMTPIELNRKGFQALVDSLGYVDAVRFIKQFGDGEGDYTRDRDRWLGDRTLEAIWAELKSRHDTGFDSIKWLSQDANRVNYSASIFDTTTSMIR
jgi:hypothetical protein